MNDFEKPFRDALTDLEVTPPEGGWPPIEAALDRSGFDYRLYGLLLLLLLLIGLGSLVSYHVATHAVGQQRAATEAQHAASSEATSLAPSAVVSNNVEVPCDDTTLATGVSADAENHRVLAADNTGSIPDSTVEVACTHLVDAGEVYVDTMMSNDLARQRSVAIDATRNRVIRRNHDNQPLHPRRETARTSREQKNDDGEENREGRGLLARNSDRPGKAIQVRREDRRTRGKGVRYGEVIEVDSVVHGLNGPPMPFRKRNTPQAALLALTSLDKLKRIHAEEKKPKVSESDSVEEKKRAERALSKWSLQFQAGANYTFKKMDPAKDLYYVTGLNNKNQASWRNAGYQVSVTARYPLARRTMLTTGISWNMLQEHTDYNYYNIIADSVEVQHIADKSIEVNAYSRVRRNDVTNTLHYLGVHLGVIQQVTFLRHERNILLALHVNRQVAATNRTLNAGHRFAVNDLRIALRAGLENRVVLSRHHVLTLTPFLEQSFGSVYSEKSVYTLRPIQVGLDVGLVLPFYKRR